MGDNDTTTTEGGKREELIGETSQVSQTNKQNDKQRNKDTRPQASSHTHTHTHTNTHTHTHPHTHTHSHTYTHPSLPYTTPAAHQTGTNLMNSSLL